MREIRRYYVSFYSFVFNLLSDSESVSVGAVSDSALFGGRARARLPIVCSKDSTVERSRVI